MDIYPPIQNKYYKWYQNICEKNRTALKQQGLIRHHIDPKSFYTKYSKDGWKISNPDIKENLVYLTEREHFIVHWLLCKSYEQLAKQKMCNAFQRMCNGNKTSKYYTHARKLYIETRKDTKRENNPSWKGGKIIILCQSCGKSYLVFPKKALVSKYCSSFCRILGSKEAISKNHHDVSGKNNPMYGTIRTKTIHTPIGIFASISLAGQAYGKSVTTIKRWKRNKPNDFYYVK